MVKNFLVTGGSGFIGSEAVRTLLDQGFNVYNMDKLTYASSQESLENYNSKSYDFYHGDITNPNDVSLAIDLSQPNYILNFAAESHVDRSIDEPDEFINTNIIGTYNLLKYSLKFFEKLKLEEKKNFKFIHISTDEVYGSLDFNDDPSTEISTFRPNSPYSASKASSDMLVRSWYKTYKLPINITHSSNNYGPWQFPEKLIPLTVGNALSCRPIEVYGDGKNIRDWIFVKDNVDAIIKVALEGKKGETYNIGGNNEISNIDIVNKICSLLDIILPLNNFNYSDLITFVDDRPGHDRRYSLDTVKILKDTAWSPRISIDEGLEISIKWMLDNKDWLLKKSKNHSRIGLKNK